ncbi:MAG: alpha/beta hydrolase [Alphaproteobacteria bacterium]|nr:alpha/beta hydrolase [Alphaproteobacteria bacterium]
MVDYTNGTWTSSDGLALHYRDYPGRDDRPPVLCLHGLTRNARDFADLADRIAGEWRVVVPEMRGRGESEYARDAASYNPIQYLGDVNLLLERLGVSRFVSIGTSMGGLMTMLIAMNMPERLAGVVLNDIGTRLERPGLQRILSYAGQGRTHPTWVHAARALEETQRVAHPQFELADWIAMAKRTMTLTSKGRIVFDYDMKIAEVFAKVDFDNQSNLSPAIDAMADIPLLILRGEVSDLFSEANCAEILAGLHDAEAVTVPGVGHAPLLTEPEAAAAIDRLLAKVA